MLTVILRVRHLRGFTVLPMLFMDDSYCKAEKEAPIQYTYILSQKDPILFYVKSKLFGKLFPFLGVNISFLKRDHIGLFVGIDSTTLCLSEIIYTFPRPLGRKWEN